jgi:hypothetical protein
MKLKRREVVDDYDYDADKFLTITLPNGIVVKAERSQIFNDFKARPE